MAMPIAYLDLDEQSRVIAVASVSSGAFYSSNFQAHCGCKQKRFDNRLNSSLAIAVFNYRYFITH